MNDQTDYLDQRTAWWTAIRDNDLKAAQDLLDAGFDIEELNSRSETAFLFCAGNGKLEAAQWLAQKGVDLTATDATGSSALHLIVRRGADKEIDDVVKIGVSVDAVDNRGTPPLLLAATHERRALELVEALLRNNANPNIVSKSSTTPLLAAAANSDMRVFNAILEAGADHLAMGVRGSILHSLLESDAKDAEEVAVKMVETYKDLDVNQLSRAGSTPLAFAVSRGSRGAIKALLKAGADPNARGASKLGSQMTALMMLAMSEHDEESFNLAFGSGADPSLRDDNGFTALGYALVGGLTEKEIKPIEKAVEAAQSSGQKIDQKQVDAMIEDALWGRRFDNIEALINGGANPKESLSGDGRSAYHAALALQDKDKRLAAIKWLGEKGFAVSPGRASVQFPIPQNEWADEIGEMMMIKFHDEDTIEALIDAGMDPKRQSEKDGTTLLHSVAKVSLFPKEQAAIAIAQRKLLHASSDEEKNKEAIESLQKQVDEMVNKIDLWRNNMLTRLVEVAGGIDIPDKTGLTPLGYFVANNVSALAEGALAHGANPMHCDEDGDHVISVAIKTGNIKWLHRLIAQVGPDSEVLSNLFLDMAYSSPEAGSRVPFIAAIQSLLETDGGVSRWLNTRDEDGNTPLIIAAATKQEDLVDTFLAMGADPNLQSNSGNTALHYAITEDRGDIVKRLLACGADAGLKNTAGKSSEELAVNQGTPYISRAMRERDGEKPTFEVSDEIKKVVSEAKEKANTVQAPSRRMGM